jgi:hypothetical protein
MEPSQALDMAKRSLTSFSQWLDENVKPLAENRFPLEFSSWRKELELIRTAIENHRRLQIALVGTTGAGKSTFLNAVLGQEVLPVGVMSPCTAFVTAVSHSSDNDYVVEVHYCTREQWEQDLIPFISSLQPGDDGEEAGTHEENRRLQEAARKRIRAVYAIQADTEIDANGLMNHPFPPEVKRIFSGDPRETKRFSDPKEMLKFLRGLIRGESPLWPLIRQVNVSGPYECLAGGLELIDLPGLNDPNEARVEVTREFLRTSPFVWVVFQMVRGLTEDIKRILREEKLLRTLVLSGSYSSLSLIGTKADDVDADVSEQLGLSEDCTQEDLIRAYRDKTVTEARLQLEQMVLDLASHSDEGPTLERMVQMARHVQVHTTSARAYNKIKGVGRLKKDYGLADERDTGIPDVHEHLKEIGKTAGSASSAEMATNQLDKLKDEITFFFRAKEKAPTPEVEQARSKLPQERDRFSQRIKEIQSRADDQLKGYRERFLEKMDPLFETSVQGVQRVAEGWQGIHWATLRAIVHRNGFFKNYQGRSFDLNEDLAEPLLQQLPVSWERYFTDQVGGVTNDFALRVTEAGKSFCEKVQLIIELLLKKEDKGIEEQLKWFQDKVSLLARNARGEVLSKVKERRSELAAKMPKIALARMQPAYDLAKKESGPGMKKRILGIIERSAIDSAQPIYVTIREDLTEGLNDLEIIIVGMFQKLTQAANKQAGMVADNANIDVEEASVDPDIAHLLQSVPKLEASLGSDL